MLSSKADLYFFEELTWKVGREQSLQWLMSETFKTLSTSKTRSSHCSSQSCRALPRRKFSEPDIGMLLKNMNSLFKPEADTSIQNSDLHKDTIQSANFRKSTTRTRRASTSHSLVTCSSSSEWGNSFQEFDTQLLFKLSLTANDADSSRLGLMFTDAAHSVLDSAHWEWARPRKSRMLPFPRPFFYSNFDLKWWCWS